MIMAFARQIVGSYVYMCVYVYVIGVLNIIKKGKSR